MEIIVLILITFFYAWSGMEGENFFQKNARKFGIPILVSLYCWNLFGLLLIIPLSLGYGIPDDTDEGSTLGKFWYNVFDGNHFLSNLATRLTIGGLISTILFILTFHWWVTLFAIWYIFWSALCKADDRLILGLSLEELLIGFGLGICLII